MGRRGPVGLGAVREALGHEPERAQRERRVPARVRRGDGRDRLAEELELVALRVVGGGRFEARDEGLERLRAPPPAERPGGRGPHHGVRLHEGLEQPAHAAAARAPAQDLAGEHALVGVEGVEARVDHVLGDATEALEGREHHVRQRLVAAGAQERQHDRPAAEEPEELDPREARLEVAAFEPGDRPFDQLGRGPGHVAHARAELLGLVARAPRHLAEQAVHGGLTRGARARREPLHERVEGGALVGEPEQRQGGAAEQRIGERGFEVVHRRRGLEPQQRAEGREPHEALWITRDGAREGRGGVRASDGAEGVRGGAADVRVGIGQELHEPRGGRALGDAREGVDHLLADVGVGIRARREEPGQDGGAEAHERLEGRVAAAGVLAVGERLDERPARGGGLGERGEPLDGGLPDAPALVAEPLDEPRQRLLRRQQHEALHRQPAELVVAARQIAQDAVAFACVHARLRPAPSRRAAARRPGGLARRAPARRCAP